MLNSLQAQDNMKAPFSVDKKVNFARTFSSRAIEPNDYATPLEKKPKVDVYCPIQELIDKEMSHISPFFHALKEMHPFGKYRTKKPVFITVNHILPTIFPYLHALSTLGTVRAVIPKGPADIQPGLRHYVNQNYPLLPSGLKKTLSGNPHYALDLINQYVKDNESVIILDIGGYFAPSLEILSAHASCVIGIVEGTQNGHQRYAKAIKERQSHSSSVHSLPIYSVAQSEIKSFEDFRVGKAIVNSVESILNSDAHRSVTDLRNVGIIGFGNIGSSCAFHLKQHGIHPIIHEIDPLRKMSALLHNHILAPKEKLLRTSALILSATGNKVIQEKDIAMLPDEVFIATVTSPDDEMNMDALEKSSRERISPHNHINSFKNEETDKTIHLISRGNASNFSFNAVEGEYIYAVHACVIKAAFALWRKVKPFDVHKVTILTEAEEKTIAALWLAFFESKKTTPEERAVLVQNIVTENATKDLEDMSAVSFYPCFSSPVKGYVRDEVNYSRLMNITSHKNIIHLCGPEHTGKTQMLRDFATTYHASYPDKMVFEFLCNSYENMIKSYTQCAHYLCGKEETEGKDFNEIKLMVHTQLCSKKHENFLLLFTKVESIKVKEILGTLLPLNRKAGYVLLSSCEPNLLSHETSLLSIQQWSLKEAIAFLLHRESKYFEQDDVIEKEKYYSFFKNKARDTLLSINILQNTALKREAIEKGLEDIAHYFTDNVKRLTYPRMAVHLMPYIEVLLKLPVCIALKEESYPPLMFLYGMKSLHHIKMGQYKEAGALLTEMKAKFEAPSCGNDILYSLAQHNKKLPTIYATCLFHLGKMYFKNSDKQSLFYLEEASRLRSLIDSHVQYEDTYCEVIHHSGSVYKFDSSYYKRVKWDAKSVFENNVGALLSCVNGYEELLAQHEELPYSDPFHQASCYNGLAKTHRKLFMLEKKTEYYDLALIALRRALDLSSSKQEEPSLSSCYQRYERTMAKIFFSYGSILLSRGEEKNHMQNAEHMLIYARNLLLRGGQNDALLGEVYYRLASLYIAQEKNNKAESALESCMHIFHPESDAHEKCITFKEKNFSCISSSQPDTHHWRKKVSESRLKMSRSHSDVG